MVHVFGELAIRASPWQQSMLQVTSDYTSLVQRHRARYVLFLRKRLLPYNLALLWKATHTRARRPAK